MKAKPRSAPTIVPGLRYRDAPAAKIVIEPADQDYGGRLYSCRDPEGHLWNFGSYDPWAESGGKE